MNINSKTFKFYMKFLNIGFLKAIEIKSKKLVNLFEEHCIKCYHIMCVSRI